MKCPLYEVVLEADLNDINVAAPAIAFVRQTGDFYFRHEAAYWAGVSTEAGRWVRSPFSGGRAMLRATTMGVVSQKAGTQLYRLVGTDPEKFDPTKFENIGGYWEVIKTALRRIRNDWFLELNTKECQDEDVGPLLYDIAEGDIVIEVGNDPRFVQEELLGADTLRQDNYDLHKLSTRPIKLGTPGIHLQYAHAAASPFSMHPERIGYIVLSAEAPKGATSLSVNIFPASLPKGEYESRQEWVVDNSFNDGISYNPSPRVTAPTQGPWAHRKMAIIPAPYGSVKIPVSYEGLAGGQMQAALTTTLEFADPLPFPIYMPGNAMQQPTTLYIPDRTSSFIWAPIGAHGGGMGQTELQVQIGHQGEEYIDCGGPGGLPGGLTRIPLYRSWIGPVGQRRHSNLRGIKAEDYVTFAGDPIMYKVVAVENNRLEEPSAIIISPKREAPFPAQSSTLDGIWLSEITVFRYDGFDRGGLEATLLGWPFPNGEVRAPLLVKGSGDGIIRLWAPIAEAIPIGTRLPIYVTTDLDTATFAYHDDYEFQYQLERYNNITYKITREKIGEALEKIGDLLAALTAAEENAEIKASTYWFSPPYYVNKDINEFFPTSKFGQFGATFAEANATLTARGAELRDLLRQGPPSIGLVEFISLINYGVKAIS